MNGTQIVGTALFLGGVAGYVVGVYAAYPGRALSVAGVMVGITLVVVGRAEAAEGHR